MPETTVKNQHVAGLAADVYFVGVWRMGGDAVVAGGVVGTAVALWHDEGAAVFYAKGREHPQRRQVQEHIGVWRRNMAGIALVKGPIGMPLAALVALLVDNGRDKGYA